MSPGSFAASDVLVECVPNISSADAGIVVGVTDAALASGCLLLGVSSCRDHNRTVITFAGKPEAAAYAAFRMVEKAAELIDIGTHKGAHPRIGAADVLPFVPMAGADMALCAGLAREVGGRIYAELGIPVYFYGEADTADVKKTLADIRRGGLPPDIGDKPHPKAGAVAAGARRPLIAFNINLDTADVSAARRIAKAIRETSGGLKNVKALGLYLPEKGFAQVSMNLTDYTVTPPRVVFGRVAELAAGCGVNILHSELVGLMPQAALTETRAGAINRAPTAETARAEAVKAAEMLKIKDFCYEQHIVEAHGVYFT